MRIYFVIAQLQAPGGSSTERKKVEQQTFRDIKFLVLGEVGAHNSISLVEILSEFLFIRISWAVHDIKS